MGSCHAMQVHMNNDLDPKAWNFFVLMEVETIGKDVMRFRFGIPSKKLVCPCGFHVAVRCKHGAKGTIARSYTPIATGPGWIDLLVKIYHKTEKFPDGGIMSQHLADMKVGEEIEMKGPLGEFEYNGKGEITVYKENKTKNKIGLIAGGTGLASMIQIMRNMKDNVNDQTECWLIFINKTEEDIFMRDELEKYTEPNFHLHLTLSKPPPTGWTGGIGYIDEEMIKAHMPAPGDDTFILISGRPGMVFSCCVPTLENMGYTEDMYFAF